MSRRNEHGQPVGEAVTWSPAAPPRPVELVGRHVRLVPAIDHVGDLYAALCGPDDDALWTYLGHHKAQHEDELAAAVAQVAARADAVPFALLVEGRALGLASLMRADPGNGSIEIGGVCLARSLQRTRAATEAFSLFARHVFDDLGHRRYEWKCDALNEPSRRAARRLGFTEEGTFRNAVVTKGRSRDTTWFSITDAEWPRVRAAYDAWLEDANFDEAGRQRSSLRT